MQIKGKVVVVTGGADGIGRALVQRFHQEGAKSIVVADMNTAGALSVAKSVGGRAVRCDVGSEKDIQGLVAETERDVGPIGLFCSNAGIANFGGGADDCTSSSNEQWQRGWQVNVMAHVYAARACLPAMIARGGGTFLNTVSAAGLPNQIGDPVYAATKHAAVSFAENLAITHHHQGIRVSMLCPQAVETTMLREVGEGAQNVDGVFSPYEVARCVVEGLAVDKFLILAHPEGDHMRKKTENYDRWIGGMVELRRSFTQQSALCLR